MFLIHYLNQIRKKGCKTRHSRGSNLRLPALGVDSATTELQFRSCLSWESILLILDVENNLMGRPNRGEWRRAACTRYSRTHAGGE
jgi:hypothetical protein